MRHVSAQLLAVLGAFLLVTSGAFIVDASGVQRPDPVPFDETIDMGATAATTIKSETEGIILPKAQVFYSQYRYVVGYYGITSLVDDLHRPGNQQQFGRPLTIYVTDFSTAEIELTAEGYITIGDQLGSHTGWVPADEAYFVVDSKARTPTGTAVVAFSRRSDAVSFSETYGGTIERWPELKQRRFGTLASSRTRYNKAIRAHDRWANQTVETALTLLDRPVAIKVTDDGPTLAAAIDRAPPNRTIILESGTYRGNITIDKPITIRGAGQHTVVNGDGTSSVITVRSDRVAVTDLRLTGVGNTTIAQNISVNQSDWDYRVQMGYGYGDAGVTLASSNHSLIHNVAIETPANGVVVRNSRGAVIENVSSRGTENWVDGFMGVMVMDARVVVQQSHFVGGRDGVYTHLGDGSVIRDNRMESMRFGVHEMYTSEVLVADNVATDTNIGIVVMTRPMGNLLVGNTVKASRAGIVVAGQDSYVRDNVVAYNGIGIGIGSYQSLYEYNTVIGNDVGLRASTLLPTNRVTANDIVGNQRYVSATLGPLRVWSGNYWWGAPGVDSDGDGRLDRSFVPSGPVDSLVDTTVGARTLARSPAVMGSRSLRNEIPGLRMTGVIDPSPRSQPVHPTIIERMNKTDIETDRRINGGT